MVTLEHFVTTAAFGPVTSGASFDSVVREFGEPEAVEPERKSYPLMALYGDVEFRFRSDKLTTISIRLDEESPVSAPGISVEGLWPESARTMDSLRKLLESRGVGWTLDPVMSDINPEESSQVWITDHNVHLGFFDGVLQNIAADYSSNQ
jgi:hypothetical protein